jgi:hypothetical protein
MRKNNFLLKSTAILLPLALLLVAGSINEHKSFADSKIPKSNLYQTQDSSDLDVSKGWKITEYSSSTQPDVSKVFLQGVDLSAASQMCALVQAANVGDATFAAQKVISMKKGHKYDINLIYAQFYGTKGSGYIDFNGEKFNATSDHSDQEFKKTIAPTKDMNYTITVFFKTEYPGNAYLKLGYDKNSGGIIDTSTELAAPVVNPAPEAGTDTIKGTATSGNTVIVKDSSDKELGSVKVSTDGKYEIKTNRALRYKEKLTVFQTKDGQNSPDTVVQVVDTIPPVAPVLNTITDDDTVITGNTEAYSTVEVTFDPGGSNERYIGKTDGAGYFSIQLEKKYHGKTKLVAIATDEAGLVSPETSGEVVFLNDLEVTVTNKISSVSSNISGTTSRPNCEIEILFGTRIYTGKSNDEGNYNIKIDPHLAGTDYTVNAVDPIDVENPASISGKILPRIPNFDSVQSGLTSLSGVSDPNAEITLKLMRGTDTFEFKATADAKGIFSIALKDKNDVDMPLAFGDELTFSATIANINLTSEEGNITVFAR